MAKKKKKVVTTAEKTTVKKVSVDKARKVAPSSSATVANEMTFGKVTFKWMGIGVGLMALGYIMMLGGHNEDPNVWDESVIYNWRILNLAPILILSGLGLQIYAIFKK